MRRIYIHHNNSRVSIRVKEKLIELLKDNEFYPTKYQPDIIIVIGGDGTMLSAIRAHSIKNIPFIGINTGTLGFLPSILPKDIDTLIDILKQKELKVFEYPLLEVHSKTINEEKVINYAFNEILIKHQQPKLMEALVYLNKKPFNYFTGDGFILSTPVGATGYAIWAGGVATHSDLPVFQLTPLNPNDNRINRPMKTSMIVPNNTLIDFKIIKAHQRAVIVACDGINVSDDYIAEIHVKISDLSVKILRTDDYDYFELYRQKIIDKNIYRYLK
ncbi:MAG: NAD(+)/NADH kinase [Clostridiales bacterium]|nr:NAD(+)/NADH kinase [Clostridiales bacterium]